MENNLNDLVEKAKNGDKAALNDLVKGIQQFIYNLSIRMLWHPEDAKDATQEILIKVVTNLGTFRGESSFKTWAYRVASNYLLTTKKKFNNHRDISFDEFEQQLSMGLYDSISYSQNEGEQNLLVQEIKIGCSNGMLLCLDKQNRLIYIIGEILEFTSKIGGEILDISPELFRKKLSIARKKIRNFMDRNCGIVNSKNVCRCYKKIDFAIQNKIIDPHNLLFTSNKENIKLIESIDKIELSAKLFQSNPDYNISEKILDEISQILEITQERDRA
ncbi:MAG: ECF RNA polymerase sigma factor SigW [Candidatus Scalindua rubra]|uniref:ECF RNA polymerase sigma factor SigW n=1 Tax=Candidatus Scalindua rubra TaxID=1872076 RepID=A0A1E3XBP4_9BACT|nr:MAG: ECF RNA polymerase sigma factor SigW [Candidatus Scalindua rubra]